jgi:exosortase K
VQPYEYNKTKARARHMELSLKLAAIGKRWYQVTALLFAYFILRILFQRLPEAKTLFIYPTGLIVDVFYGTGSYIQPEWIYFMGKTQFILGDTCSGTTFFSLLFSYLIYRILTLKVSWFWLAAAFPVTLIANGMRVLSSMHAHNYLTALGLDQYGDSVHAITGTATFLTCFLIMTYFIEKGKSHNDR